MDQSLIKKNDFKVNLTSFLKGNKLKIIFLFYYLSYYLLYLPGVKERKDKHLTFRKTYKSKLIFI